MGALDREVDKDGKEIFDLTSSVVSKKKGLTPAALGINHVHFDGQGLELKVHAPWPAR